jgi:hypothetical protein
MAESITSASPPRKEPKVDSEFVIPNGSLIGGIFHGNEELRDGAEYGEAAAG